MYKKKNEYILYIQRKKKKTNRMIIRISKSHVHLVIGWKGRLFYWYNELIEKELTKIKVNKGIYYYY